MTGAEKYTILVVDDEADVRKFLKMALEDAGFKVETAADGFEALAKVKAKKPDLISLDLVMPKKSGAMFYHDLQKNREWSKIPVLIVTGHAKDDLGKADLEELTMSGPGVYLEKPVKPRNFVAAVEKLLGMEPSESAKEATANDLKGQLSELMDKADPETLKKMIEAAKKKP